MAAEKTPEQIAAEEEKARKAEAKRLKDLEAAKKKEDAEAKKAAKKAEADAKKEAKAKEKEAKEQAKADAKAAREAARMPEANGVRRPKPETACGKAWAIFDELSAKRGEPCAIGDALEVAKEKGLNAGNVRCEYAAWRKYYGVSGRVEKEGAEEARKAAEAEKQKKADEAAAKKAEKAREEQAKKDAKQKGADAGAGKTE